MSIYSYEATNFASRTINGEMEAVSRDAVIDHLRLLGYTPLAVDQKVEGWIHYLKKLKSPKKKQFPLKDLVFLTQELMIMLRAGLPLERALSILASIADKMQMKKFLEETLALVRSGMGLADALDAQNMDLPKGYTGMVRAGEAGGAHVLESTLERLGDHLNRTQKAKDFIFSAMLYPSIVLVMAMLSIALILLFVLPQFEPIFESAHDALPLSTQIIIGAGHLLRNYGIVFLFVIAMLVVTARFILRKKGMRLKKDVFFLRLPKIGTIIIKIETARFCNMLGVLLSNRVAPVVAISIAAESLGNQVFVNALKRVVVKVKEGETLSLSLFKEKVLPVFPLQMIKIGEETGQLDSMLLKTAEIYDRDVQSAVDRLMTLVTPLTTIILGFIIAAIIASILSAILSVNDMVT